MLEKFIEARDIVDETAKSYRITVNQYTKFHNLTLEELITEAWNDDEEIRNIHKRKINDRIFNFRTELKEVYKLETTTINKKIGNLQTIYTHYGIEFPKVRGLKDKRKQLTYFDLPTKEHICLALESTTIHNQALILFLASSGTGRAETASITIQDFIDATSEYHNGGTLEEILDEIYSQKDVVVPTFSLRRQKTNKTYYTFCTPEATFAIVNYLRHELKKQKIKNRREKTEEEINLSKPLFASSARSISQKLNKINDKLGFGFKGKDRFFRPHTLRKFHASNIGLSAEYIDTLQGRAKDKIHATYIKTNPAHLKKVYINVMENVTVNLEAQRTVINEEYHIHNHIHFHADEGMSLL